jgi:hypothetical protein
MFGDLFKNSRFKMHFLRTFKIVSIEEDSVHPSGQINRHIIRNWNNDNSHIVVEVKGEGLKISILCAVSKLKVFLRVFFFLERAL